jgi:hypothetical protein
VTQDSDDHFRGRCVDTAEAFLDEFDSLSLYQYLWAEPAYYGELSAATTNQVDLAISFGHGSHHHFDTGAGNVILSGTAFGNFRPCGGHGDLEYLAFFSCSTLSLDDSGGDPWRFFWANGESTASMLRPFTGLHMVLGFRTVVESVCFFTCSDEEMVEAFAANLDAGDRVIDAWQEAVGDEMGTSRGFNRGAVFYLQIYEGDTLDSDQDDFIYGSPHYVLVADYWD